MDLFIKASGFVLLAIILGFTVGKQWKEAGIVLTIAVCCMVIAAAMDYLTPVIDLIRKLQSEANLDSDLIRSLLKIVGIGLIAQICELLCADSGNASLGKALQLLGAAVILWMSVPLFNELLELVSQILGGI